MSNKLFEDADSIPAEERWKVQWRSVEHGAGEYGELFYGRAVGGINEMESSKAAARRIAAILKEGETIFDVGCGAGHYLRSLRNLTNKPFYYHGIDATELYIEYARKAFSEQPNVAFDIGDIYALSSADKAADVTMCNNVLLHLPSVEKPIAELLRVSRRYLLVRTLVSDNSYIVKRVTPDQAGDEFDENGEPHTFHYLNIYSEAYLRRVISKNKRVATIDFEPDRDFDPASVADSKVVLNASSWNATTTQDGLQHSGMLSMPWTWIYVELNGD